MPSSFDLKDADGNILMSVDNAKYDEDFFTTDYSQSEEDASDPEEESSSNKKR